MLAIEARGDPDVHVCVVSPGGVDTPVYLQAANYAGCVGRPPPPVDSPEKVARGDRATSLRDHRPRRSVGAANLVRAGRVHPAAAVFDLLVGPLMRAGGLSREPVEPHDGNVFEPRRTATPARPLGPALAPRGHRGRGGGRGRHGRGGTAPSASAGADQQT